MTTLAKATAFENLNPLAAYNPESWQRINRDLCAKVLSECIYEELLQPQLVDADTHTYQLDFGDGNSYRFQVKPRAFFGFMRVIPDSLVQLQDGEEVALEDAYCLLGSLNAALGVKADTAAYAIREFSNTLLGDCHQMAAPRLTNAELLKSDEIQIESQLIAHPWIIANKGRLGFSYSDYLQFAPEMAQEAPLLWIGVNKEVAQYNGLSDLDYERLINEELSEQDRNHFAGLLRDLGLAVEDYLYMPVHPWQWNNEIVSLFCREIVARRIVPLDAGSDNYQAQQSIRTFSNRDNPRKRYVKLPISILNTSVYRGLPPERVRIAPALSQWLLDEVANDPFLRDETRLILLGEVATINVDHPIYSKMQGVPYQFREKLAVVWRESVHSKMDEGEHCVPLAALMHYDANGEPFLKSIIAASGMTTAEWLQQFLKVVMEPLLHVLYKYGFVFSPHGQNAMLVMKGFKPSRLAVKDFVDDANICVDPIPEQDSLPEELEDILESLEGPILIQWIQSGLFVCVFRYLTEVLEDHMDYREVDFWQQVLESVQNYQKRFPELEDRFAAFDLLRPVFPKLCLNRVRLLDKGYQDDAERPSAAVSSMLENPLALLAK
ncbi:rhizobactin siderophore biosynthesis protein RhbF [Maricurvus nonylphenolicus]|uniref:IucA/IucC family protein n=1 Tax=Maricurvus nonylphenolicus TaxID=1008307 RepID=UPI0036F2ED05